jgi:hypothetical protein
MHVRKHPDIIYSLGEIMNISKTKSTKRFNYTVNLNDTAKQAGSNVVTISTLPIEDSRYSIGQTSLTMTVREAKALNSFLSYTLS